MRKQLEKGAVAAVNCHGELSAPVASRREKEEENAI
jgi:hypothetical protein